MSAHKQPSIEELLALKKPSKLSNLLTQQKRTEMMEHQCNLHKTAKSNVHVQQSTNTVPFDMAHHDQ